MAVYLAWTGQPLPADTPGPWRELRPGPPGLTLIDSDDRQSRVFHELKWALPEDTALFVTRLDTRPKLKNVPPGTLAWLRVRLPLPDQP